jgi:hypothetical protein
MVVGQAQAEVLPRYFYFQGGVYMTGLFNNGFLLWPIMMAASFIILFMIGHASVYDDYDTAGWYIHANANRQNAINITTVLFLVVTYVLFFIESGTAVSTLLGKITGITDEFTLGIIAAIGALGVAILIGRVLAEIAIFGSRVKAAGLRENIDRYISSVDEEESKSLAYDAFKGFVKDEPTLLMDRIAAASIRSKKRKIAKNKANLKKEKAIVVAFPNEENAINL